MEKEVENYFGPIELIEICNESSLDHAETPLFKDNNIRIVHYPDCQQMVIMLPEYFSAFEYIIIKNEESDETIYQKQIHNEVGGSIQIIIDSLFIPPGRYVIIINRFDGGSHKIRINKHLPIVNNGSKIGKGILYDRFGYIMYRDGNGKILPNEDLELRENLMEKLNQELAPDIVYYSQGRDGYLIYTEQNKSFRCDMEMGGGNVMFTLFIPSSEHWEANTGFPLSERDRILSIIARTTQREQAGGLAYLLGEREIIYYKNLE